MVLTSDKFTSLFGNLIPSLSLLLVMVLRMIPNLLRRGNLILGARRSIGRSTKEKLEDGFSALGALTSWALEGSVATADSMRSRGYGTGRRSSFMIYRLTGEDRALLILLPALLLAALLLGVRKAEFTPVMDIAPLSGRNAIAMALYGAYLLIPTVLHIKEALQWHISRSRI